MLKANKIPVQVVVIN